MNELLKNDNRTAESAGFSGAALWASAFVILAMIVVQAGRVSVGPSAAYAGDVATTGDLTVLTAAGGDNQDVLVVLDRRLERIFLYGIENRTSVRLYENHDLAEMFTSARNSVRGGVSSRP